MAGQPFVEPGAPDAAAARDFFASVLGWRFEGEVGQGWFDTPGGPVGLHGGDDPMIVVYLPVPDVDAAAEAVLRNGGTVMGAINEEPGFGRFATCADPQRVRFGLHQKPA